MRRGMCKQCGKTVGFCECAMRSQFSELRRLHAATNPTDDESDALNEIIADIEKEVAARQPKPKRKPKRKVASTGGRDGSR